MRPKLHNGERISQQFQWRMTRTNKERLQTIAEEAGYPTIAAMLIEAVNLLADQVTDEREIELPRLE